MTSGAEQAAAAARAARKNKPDKPAASKPTPKLTKSSIFGGVISAYFSKETGMAKYSKLIGAFIGSIVGIALSYLASRGLATCSIVDGTESCTLWGMSQAQITGFLIMLAGNLGTYIAPPNSPLISSGKK